MHKKTDSILALDPGLRDLGYAVFQGKRLLTSGVLALRTIPAQLKLTRVRESLLALTRAYDPRTLVLEQIPRRPLDSIGGLPSLARSLTRLAKTQGLELAQYSARTVRGHVVGNGWAGKRETAEAVSALYPELRVYLDQNRKWKEGYWQNMFDAVALGRHHQVSKKPPSRSR